MGQKLAAARAPVLIVEDNPETLQVLERIIAFQGYAVVTADDGLEALAYLRTGAPASVIVLDMRMPNMDGCALRRALQVIPDSPVSRSWSSRLIHAPQTWTV